MNVTWLVNVPLYSLASLSGTKRRGSGFWLDTLSERLRPQIANFTIINLSPRVAKIVKHSIDGVSYVTCPATPLQIAGLSPFVYRTKTQLKRVIDESNPDIVDFHGTEYSQVSIASSLDLPNVITLQGLVSEIAKRPAGEITFPQMLGIAVQRTKSPLHALRVVWEQLTLTSRAAIELEALKRCRAFIGRTQFDYDTLARANQKEFAYFNIPRILRESFYSGKWSNSTSRDLFACGRAVPLKGYHILIEAMRILKARNLNLSLRLTVNPNGTGWERYLKALVDKHGLNDRVNFIGYLSEDQVKRELIDCFAYIHPSLHDNSPNTLAEAQLLGVPCVAAKTGGIPSMVEHKVSGLLFANNSAVAMANAIQELLESPRLKVDLGEQARCRAVTRHDPGLITEKTLSAYRETISRYN